MGYQLEPGIRKPWSPRWPEGMEHSAKEKSNNYLAVQIAGIKNKQSFEKKLCNPRYKSREALSI